MNVKKSRLDPPQDTIGTMKAELVAALARLVRRLTVRFTPMGGLILTSSKTTKGTSSFVVATNIDGKLPTQQMESVVLLHYTKPDDTGLCHFHFAWTLRLRAQISLGD
jgi:hypothetical protein